jgi:acyl-CoA synthetase (AMP-forming)/AMP-acid ligase II
MDTRGTRCGPISRYHNIGHLLYEQATFRPADPFLIFAPSDVLTLTYGQTLNLASLAADRLARLGLERGDRLGIVGHNTPEFLVHYFAAHLLGLVLVPVNPALATREICFILRNCSARVVFFDRGLAALCSAVKAQAEGALLAEVLDGHSESGLESLWRQPAPQLRKPDLAVTPADPAALLYTSGTTGNPKGVVLTQRNFLADAGALVDWFRFESGTRTLCALPMFHNNGQVITLLSPLLVGGSTVILDPKTVFASFWPMIADYSVQWTSVMPAFLTTFLEYGMPREDETLRGIVCGGQVLPEAVARRFEEKYHVPIFEGYGLTETTSFACMNRYPAERRCPGSIGYPLPCNDMLIADEAGREVPDGEPGEIVIRGDNVAPGYHELPDVTAQRYADGWLHTGDFGWRDAAGNFYFATRKDDLIIRGGENIYPAEIENALYAIDGVVDCAAIGIPDPILGEAVCAYVKIAPGSTLCEDLLREGCRNLIADFKVPRRFILVNSRQELPEIPKGPTRKILRRELRRHFAGLVALEASAAP